ncbi:MAG: 2-phospho-L-lactate transferase [Candidatus Heimdallarchaeota archaeon]
MTDKEKIKLTFLSGGTGTPKLLLGFRELVEEKNLTIIANTGDDDHFHGLLVQPDVDALLYLFSNQLDLKKFWGVKNDTYNVLTVLAKMNLETWFQLGDKDLALHLLRNKLLLDGKSYFEIITEISNRLGIKAKILPMTNEQVRTIMFSTNNGKLSFQEYTVKYRETHEITRVYYQGSENAQIYPELKEAIHSPKTIIIGPSNPITSIGPMLAIKELRNELIKTDKKIIAISPLDQNRAFSGPAAKLLEQLGYEASSYGIAKAYQDFLDVMIISENDTNNAERITGLGIKVIQTNISMKNQIERKKLAKVVLKEINSLPEKN